MTDAFLDLVHQTIATPWVYAALFLLAALDGFFPVIPGETAIVAVAVFAAATGPHLLPVIGVAALGAFVGDHISYLIGRGAGGPLSRRMRPGTRRREAFDRARTMLERRGGLVLLASRLVPGVRSATTMTMGAVGYPLPLFSLFDSIAASGWASYWALLGYLGGAVFEDAPVKGLLLAIGVAVTMTALSEAARHIPTRRRSPAPPRMR